LKGNTDQEKSPTITIVNKSIKAKQREQRAGSHAGKKKKKKKKKEKKKKPDRQEERRQ